MRPTGTTKRALISHFFVIGTYLVLTLLLTVPVVSLLGDYVVGVGGDPWQTMWRFETKWDDVTTAVGAGEFGEYARAEWFGGGAARLVNHSVWPWIWLQPLFGQPATYNVVWLLSFVLSGYAMYLLMRYLITRRKKLAGSFELFGFMIAPADVAAWVTGLMYMLLPYHAAQARGHFGALQLQWLPLAILALLIFVRKPTWMRGLVLALAITVQAWTEHHYALWLALFIMLFAGWYWRKVRALLSSRQGLLSTGLVVALLLLFVVVPYAPTIRLAAAETNTLALGQEQTIRFSADLFAYVVPPGWQPIWGAVTQPLLTRFTGNIAEATHFLGLVPLLLIVFFGQKIPNQARRFWLTVAGVFLVISLGPRLHLLGTVTPLPLPYTIIDSWPIFSSVRVVARASVMVGLAVAILFGWVMATQVRRPKMATLVAGLIVLEFLFLPVDVQRVQLSEAYSRLEDLPGQTVVELPAATNYTAASRALYASRQHGKEIVGSIALERAAGAEELRKVRSLPALRQLLYARTTDLQEGRRDFFNQELAATLPEVLQWVDASAVLLHLDSLSPLQLAVIRGLLEEDVGLTALEFDDVVLYERPTGGWPQADGVFLARDGRWQVRLTEAGVTEATLAEEAIVTLYNITDETVLVDLRFTVAPTSHGSFVVTSDEGLLFDGAAAAGELTVVQVSVPPGELSLTWRNRLTQPIVLVNPVLSVATQ